MTILQALYARYERLAARGDLPPEGYSVETIDFVIELSPEGLALSVTPLGRVDDKESGGALMTVPLHDGNRTSNIKSYFLCDKPGYVFGIETDKKNNSTSPTPKQYEDFIHLHRKVIGDSTDIGMISVLKFLSDWNPERLHSPPFEPEMLKARNIVFMLSGDEDDEGFPRYIHDRPESRRVWDAEMARRQGTPGLCLVTGNVSPIARLHPQIKGVAAAQSSGAALVSFNADAFTSYGKEQGANAPVSEHAAFGYGAALQAMLRKGSANKIDLANITLVFWANANDKAIIKRFNELVDTPEEHLLKTNKEKRSQDKQRTHKLKQALAPVAEGRTIKEIKPDFADGTPFFLLGLSSNKSRLIIRIWLESSFGKIEENLYRYFQDTRITPWPWETENPSIFRMLIEVSPRRDKDAINDRLSADLLQAILTGNRFPLTLLSSVITRIRADHNKSTDKRVPDEMITGRRAAICRACIVRDLRLESQRTNPEKQFPQRLTTDKEKETYLVSLDRNEKSHGYLLGRLFAVLESAQYAALGKINATIRDRYYGAASATPAAVFPLLLRTSAHHIAALRKEKKGGWVDREIEEILGVLENPEFPRSLSIEQQGRFAIGYYHQRAYRKPAAEDAADTADQNTEEAEG
jgi:CRISPR-associated protein Csd1